MAVPFFGLTISIPAPYAYAALVHHRRPFSIEGGGGLSKRHVRPFTIVGTSFGTKFHSRRFSLLSSNLEHYTPPVAVATGLSADAHAGDDFVHVTSATGIIPGGFYTVTGSTELVQVRNTYVSGTTVPLVAVLANDHPMGSSFAESTDAGVFVTVFDKAGVLLGVLDTVIVSQPGTRSILSSTADGGGNASLYVARNEANVDLLRGDAIILIGDPKGQPWAGPITPQEWGDSQKQIQCGCVFELLDRRLKLSIPGAEGTTAVGIVTSILENINAQRAADGEVQWEGDLQGVATFLGDFDVDQSELEALKFVAERTMTEMSWRVSVRAGQLVPTLVLRDRFEVPGGDAMLDGPTGNIVGPIRYRRDPTTFRSAIKLVGAATDISALTPDWARWAVHEIEPEVVLSAESSDPNLRLRNDEEVSVDWSLSKAEQQALADLTSENVREMYNSFLRAVHDQWGRPFHEGWVYTGPPDNLEPGLTKDKWITDLRLVETWSGWPMSQVMRSGPKSKTNLSKRLVVTYDRVKGLQTVTVQADGDLNTGAQWRATIKAGTHNLYKMAGGMAVDSGQNITGVTTRTVGGLRQIRSTFPGVTYRYGGRPNWRGEFITVVAATERSSPYVRSDNKVTVLPKGTHFACRQSTTQGTSIHGSTLWHGNYNGTQWLHDSVVKVIGHNNPTNAGYRRILEGGGEGLWIITTDISSLVALSGDNSDEFIEKIYPFEVSAIAKWDPARDGVGVEIVRPTVVYGAKSTAKRWHFASWSAEGWTSQLDQGISDAETHIIVLTDMGAPDPPFTATIGDDTQGSTEEDVLVTATDGPIWTVTRGQNATVPIVHEAGEAIVRKDVVEFDGFDFGYEWAEGQARAQIILDLLNREVEQFEFDVVDDDVAGVELGSIHSVTLTTEGPWPGGVPTRTVRVVGFARDQLAGTLSLVLETQP